MVVLIDPLPPLPSLGFCVCGECGGPTFGAPCTGPNTSSAAATELDHLLEPGNTGPSRWSSSGGEYWVKLKLNVLACELAEI